MPHMTDHCVASVAETPLQQSFSQRGEVGNLRPYSGPLPDDAQHRPMAETSSILSFRKAFSSFSAMLDWHSCSSPRYWEHLRAQRLSPDTIRNLRLPANRRLLFFGHSYLRQVLDNILVANTDLLTNLYEHRFQNAPNFSQRHCSGRDGPMNITMHPIRRSKWAGTDPILLNFGGINSTVLFIHNFAPLQHTTCMENLRSFLSQQGAFENVFYMLPHMDCWFEHPERRCIDLGAMPPNEEQACTLQHIFRRHARRVIEVMAWDELSSNASVKSCCRERLHTAPFFSHAGFCRVEKREKLQCTDDRAGHQCNPGALTWAAVMAVRMMNRTTGNESDA